MVKHKLILFVLVHTTLFGQTETYYRGEDGEHLIIVDSNSFLPKYLWSDYFVDSATYIPYSGIGTKWFAGIDIPVDSFCLRNGVQNGFRIENCDNDQGFLAPKISYLNQDEGIELIVNYQVNRRDSLLKKGNSYILFKRNGLFTSYQMDFKCRKVVINYKVFNNTETIENWKKRINHEEFEAFIKEQIGSNRMISLVNKMGFFRLHDRDITLECP